MTQITRRIFLASCIASGIAATGSPSAARRDRSVVVYTSLDEMYSRPILDKFTSMTGITVRSVYDTEASKTVGLVTRLIAEKKRPRADVFWNSETAQTIVLKSKGVLTPYRSPSSEAIPPQFKDPEAYWTGFAARARVVIYHKDLVKEPPRSVLDFLKPEWAGKAAIAHPLFGTTATHAAALFALWGEERAKGFLSGLLKNRVAVLPGNATVRDLVAAGEYHVGLTDTDDANGAVADGLPARWLFPDQQPDGMGTLVIPNSVALIAGGPAPDAGKALIDYLLSPDVEKALAQGRSMQIPLNPAVSSPEKTPRLSEIRAMDVRFEDIGKMMGRSSEFVKKEFLR